MAGMQILQEQKAALPGLQRLLTDTPVPIMIYEEHLSFWRNRAFTYSLSTGARNICNNRRQSRDQSRRNRDKADCLF